MIYLIKGGFYEEIQRSKVFFETGIDCKTLEKMNNMESNYYGKE